MHILYYFSFVQSSETNEYFYDLPSYIIVIHVHWTHYYMYSVQCVLLCLLLFTGTCIFQKFCHFEPPYTGYFGTRHLILYKEVVLYHPNIIAHHNNFHLQMNLCKEYYIVFLYIFVCILCRWETFLDHSHISCKLLKNCTKKNWHHW